MGGTCALRHNNGPLDSRRTVVHDWIVCWNNSSTHNACLDFALFYCHADHEAKKERRLSRTHGMNGTRWKRLSPRPLCHAFDAQMTKKDIKMRKYAHLVATLCCILETTGCCTDYVRNIGRTKAELTQANLYENQKGDIYNGPQNLHHMLRWYFGGTYEKSEEA